MAGIIPTHATRKVAEADAAQPQRVVQQDVWNDRREAQQKLHPRPLTCNRAPDDGHASIAKQPGEEPRSSKAARDDARGAGAY